MDKPKKETDEQLCATYRCQIISIVTKIKSLRLLKRIYELAEYLYVYANEKG